MDRKLSNVSTLVTHVHVCKCSYETISQHYFPHQTDLWVQSLQESDSIELIYGITSHQLPLTHTQKEKKLELQVI